MDEEVRGLFAKLSPEDRAVLRWRLQRREPQVCPRDENGKIPYVWFLRAGRGSGKTYAAANHVFEYCKNLEAIPDNRIIYLALIGERSDDTKLTMVEGPSGLRSIIPKNNLVNWNRSMGELKWWCTAPDGSRREVHAKCYASEKPEAMRGPNLHIAWVDEPAKFKDADQPPKKVGTTWSNMTLGLRSGRHVHIVVTGTPSACALVLYLHNHKRCLTTRMHMRDNAENLAEEFLEEMSDAVEGSKLARQELAGDLVLDDPDALFLSEVLENTRLSGPPPGDLTEVMGYDPAASSGEDADLSGIVVVGHQVIEEEMKSGKVRKVTHAYPLLDLSGRYTPAKGTQLVIKTILDRKVATLCVETNQGVDILLTTIEQALKDATDGEYVLRKLPNGKSKYGSIKRWRCITDDHSFEIRAVHAFVGKALRAEPVSREFELGRGHMPAERMEDLENQMTTWAPTKRKSPDRLDAFVYACLFIYGENMLRARHDKKYNSGANLKLVKDNQLDPYRTSLVEAAQSATQRSTIWSVDVGQTNDTGFNVPGSTMRGR